MSRTKRLHAIDLALLLLLTLSIVFCFLRFDRLRDPDTAELDGYRMLLRLESLDPHLADCFSVGEEVRGADKEWRGRIVAIEVRDATEQLIHDGKAYRATWDRDYKCTLLVTVETVASERDGVLYLDGRYAVGIGANLCICTDRTRVIGIIYKFLPAQDA